MKTAYNQALSIDRNAIIFLQECNMKIGEIFDSKIYHRFGVCWYADIFFDGDRSMVMGKA